MPQHYHTSTAIRPAVVSCGNYLPGFLMEHQASPSTEKGPPTLAWYAFAFRFRLVWESCNVDSFRFKSSSYGLQFRVMVEKKFAGFSRDSHTCWLLSYLFLMGNELHIMEIGLYGTLFGQARWKFLLDLSNKGAVKSNPNYIKFISHKKESIMCAAAMRTSEKPCKFLL